MNTILTTNNRLFEIFNSLQDTSLANLNFYFANKKISIEFLFWDDIQKQEVPMIMNLHGISKFNSEYDGKLDFNVTGCHSANCELVNENEHEVTFLFDFLKQAVAWKVEIRFQTLDIEGGLSEEAKEYKYKQPSLIKIK